MTSKKILVVMSDTGGGHRSAAEAIASAVRRREEDYDVKILDILSSSYFPVNQACLLYAANTVYFPALWGWLWHSTNGEKRAKALVQALEPFVRKRLKAILRDENPTAIVSVHPLLTHVTSSILQEMNWRVLFFAVITDLIAVHHTWTYGDVDCLITATEEAKEAALNNGVPPHIVKVMGHPAKLEFSHNDESISETRERLGLDPLMPTILLVGGGEGTGRIYDFSLAISQMKCEVQLVIVTGRNKRLKEKLTQASFAIPVKVCGFVTNMAALMHASDAIVTRAGPGILSEALACGLPIVITGALPGQEEDNIDYVVKNGAGILATRPQELATTLEELLFSRRDKLAEMARNSSRLGRPNAATEIAELIIHFINDIA